MANTKEIKKRIDSVKNIQKITNAMYLIASTEMRKAKSRLDKTRPYFNALQGEMKRALCEAGCVKSKYFRSEPDGARAVLVITADKGLAGAYNQNVIKAAQKLLTEHPDTKLFVVGKYGRQFFMQRHIPIEQDFLFTAQNPTMDRAREIGSVLLDLFDGGEVSEIYVVYTDLKNAVCEEVISTCLLPFYCDPSETPSEDMTAAMPFEFAPSAEAVLDNTISLYVSGFIYGALTDSFCSEQNARMTAMSSANDNAQKLLDDLSVQYNRIRQAAITQEITEVSSGAKAQKRNHAKEVTNL